MNLAHQQRSPRSSVAAFRILGVFDSGELARQHAKLLPDDVDLHLTQLAKWCVVLKGRDGDEAKKLEQLLAAHRRRAREHEEEFWDNKIQQKTGKVSRPPDPLEESSVDPGDAAEADSVAKVPRNAELRLQRFAVISVLPDMEVPISEQEPAFAVWGVYDSEEDARTAAVDDIGKRMSDVHLDVVAMYEWLVPSKVDLQSVKEKFRDEQLTKLMEARKEERQRVEALKLKCREANKEPPFIDLGAPGSLPPNSIPFPEMNVQLPPLENQETKPLEGQDRPESGVALPGAV